MVLKLLLSYLYIFLRNSGTLSCQEKIPNFINAEDYGDILFNILKLKSDFKLPIQSPSPQERRIKTNGNYFLMESIDPFVGDKRKEIVSNCLLFICVFSLIPHKFPSIHYVLHQTLYRPDLYY